MATLITGSSGFIGFNLALYMLEQGEDLILTDQAVFPDKYMFILEKYASRVRVFQGDLMDQDFLDHLSALNITGMINAAVLTMPGYDEAETFIPMTQINLNTQINQLELAKRTGAQRFLYVSSSGVYGSAIKPGPGVKVGEDSTLDLFSAYCITKYAAELMLTKFADLNGISACSARIAAPYGQFERVTPARVKMSQVYTIMHQAAAGKEVTICGRDTIRDWTYVEDTVRALYSLYKAESLHYPVYNVSCSVSSSLEEVARAVQAVYPDFRYNFTDDPKQADVVMLPEGQRGNLDISRITHETGFRPRFNLRQGISKYKEYLPLEA